MAKRYVYRREEIPATEIQLKEMQIHCKNDMQRRIDFLKRKHIMEDRLLPLVDSELGLMFTRESYEDMRPYIDVSNNVARRVLREISTVYKESPQRTITPKGAEKSYEAITGSEEGFDLDARFSKANYLLNGLNDLIFQASFLGELIDLHTLTPDMVTVFENPDNPTVLDALMIEDNYLNEKGEKQTQWIFWSPTRHFIVDGQWRVKTIQDNPEMLNPYRDVNIVLGTFYPFFAVHASARENCFWDVNSGTDLFKGTLLVALQNTFRNFMIPMQFKQIAVKVNGIDTQGGAPAPIKSNQIKSPQHVFTSNGDITVLDWQSNIEALGNTIEKTIFGIAGNYGISAENFKLTAAATSGFARLISKERLNELRGEQKKIWRGAESDCFETVGAVVETYDTGFPNIPESAKFSVDFAEDRLIEDPQAAIALTKQRLEMGLTNLLDVIKDENPDITTDEEAEAYLKENIRIRNDLRTKYNIDFTFNDNQQQGANNGKAAASSLG